MQGFPSSIALSVSLLSMGMCDLTQESSTSICRSSYKIWAVLVAFARRVADHLGNRYHSVTLESWGAHSVLVTGPLCASIDAALLSGEAPWPITIPNPLHIELRPRLPEGRQYLEIDYWEVDEFHPRVKELPSQT